jgi:PhnB protein
METKTSFVPVLSIASGVKDIEFYKTAFGAVELWQIKNQDDSVHVAAYSINGNEFRLHEETKDGQNSSPGKVGSTTVTIGLRVEDVQAVVDGAVAAGVTVLSPITDYPYGYRQAELKDPFGHHWLIEKLISKEALDSFLGAKDDIDDKELPGN